MADKSGSDDKEKLLYLTQIRYLDEQLERCQRKCDELGKQNKDLACLYSALEKDKKGITEFLKRSVAAEEKKVEELSERLENQQQAAKQERETLELQHRQEAQELQERIDELKSETTMQMTEIEEQQENLRQLRQQLSVVESLKQQLVSQREEHEAAAHRLKMEASWAIEKTIERSRNREDNCVRTEVSNILQGERTQHRKMLEMLQFLQSEKVQLQKENDILRDRGRELQVRSDDLKKDLNKINQASFVPKEEVEQLRKKCQQQTEEQKQCSTAHQHTLAQIEALRQRLASVSSECSQKTAEADQLRAELQTEKSRIMQLGGVMQEAAVLLRHILTDSEKPQWKIPRLLEILESTAPRGTDSTPGDPTEKSSRGQKPQTSGPRPARTLCRQKTSSSVSPAPQGQEPPAEPDPVNRKKDECSSSCRSISK